MSGAIEVREMWSKESLSAFLWKEALGRARACGAQGESVLFVARDSGSLTGLRRHHGIERIGAMTAVPSEKAPLFYTLGMRFRFAFLIEPSDELLRGIMPLVTEQLTIARRGNAA